MNDDTKDNEPKVEKLNGLKSIEDYVHPIDEKGDSKVIDFQAKRKEKKSKEGSTSKYDFKHEDTEYNLKVDVYGNGVLFTYVHLMTQETPFGTMTGMCKHGELFIQLTRFEKFVNMLGGNIKVEDKLDKELPKFKIQTLESLKHQKEIKDRERKIQESLEN